MAEFPKLADLPDHLTVGELKRALLQPQAPSTAGFSPKLGATFARSREPSLRESAIESMAPGTRLSDFEQRPDAPFIGMGLDLAQGAQDFWEGSREAPLSPKALGGLGRAAGAGNAVDGNSLFNRDDYRLPNLTDVDPGVSEPGLMDAQAADRRRRQSAQQAPLGPKALRSIEAGKGEAKALEIGAGAEAEIKKADAEERRKREAAEFDAVQADKKLRKPFRENHPDLAGLFEFGPAIAATAGGGAGRFFANKGIKAGAERMAGLLDEFNKARAAGDLEGATLAKLALEGEQEAFGTGTAATAKGFGAAGAAGGIANTAGTTLPEGYDARNMPDGPERQRAVDKILSLEGLGLLGSRFGTGVLAGVSGYGAMGNLGRGKTNVTSKAGAATQYGTQKFDDTLHNIADSGRQTYAQSAASDIAKDASKSVVRDAKKGIAAESAAPRQIEGPKILPMADPDIKGKYLANTTKIGELKDAVAKEEAASGSIAKPRNRVRISDLRAQIKQLENENTQLKAVVMQHRKGFDDLKN